MSQKQYDDNNTGIIGTNDYKQKDTHPDQRGRACVGGLWYWVSGWNKGNNGRNFTSLAFTEMTQGEVDNMMEKRAQKHQPQQRQQQYAEHSHTEKQTQQQVEQQFQQNIKNEIADFDKDIPF